MNWLFWLGLAVCLGVIVAVTGVKPRGTRPVARSRLMGIARFVLLVSVTTADCRTFASRSARSATFCRAGAASKTMSAPARISVPTTTTKP